MPPKTWSEGRFGSPAQAVGAGSPILGIRLFCRYRIFRFLHQRSMCSIFSMFCWCRETSSREQISLSLCSARFRIISSVTAQQQHQQQQQQQQQARNFFCCPTRGNKNFCTNQNQMI